jgi:hypothetical protein
MTINKMPFRFMAILAISQLLFGCGGNVFSSELIELCDFKVPTSIAGANASFNVVYSVKVGPNGKAVSINKVVNKYLDDQLFIDCISKWVFQKNSKEVTVTFSWKHGIGWTKMSVSSKTMSRVVLFSPGWGCYPQKE